MLLIPPLRLFHPRDLRHVQKGESESQLGPQKIHPALIGDGQPVREVVHKSL
jgi:hypothetical protein